MTRVRNEELLIVDSVKHLLGFCDHVVVLDDASTDRTPELVRTFDSRRVSLIENREWATDRPNAETQDRKRLYQHAMAMRPDWVIYLDADERIDGDPRQELNRSIDGLRLRLFDAYLTVEYCDPYSSGALEMTPRLFGPEYRRILVAWRAGYSFQYLGKDQREPVPMIGARVREGSCSVRHYGKAVSSEEWETTCEYYAKNFPEPYASKWAARRGKAIHDSSSFGRPLGPWPVPAHRQVCIDTWLWWNWRWWARRVQVTLARWRNIR